MNNLKTYLTAGIVALNFSISTNGLAQSRYQQDRYDGNDALVTVYENCNFSGASSSIDVGDYRKMSGIRFGNDKMSSIKVPEGFEVTIYEHEGFRGDYARINRDLTCFDRSWNDTVSSLKISFVGQTPDRNSGLDNRPRPDFDDRRRPRDADRARQGGGSNIPKSNVTGSNVAQVVFGSSVLQQTSKKQWRLSDPRTGVSQFKETRRDGNSVYLQNDYTAERVRIDLFANDVTFSGRDGRAQRYTITRKQAALNSTTQSNSNRGSQTSTIRSECFRFRAYTRGGNGGLRFHGKDEFYRFSKKAKTARVCHNGILTMEINKTEPGTEVVVEINNKRYSFARNEKHDALRNNWYRKFVKLKVGK